MTNRLESSHGLLESRQLEALLLTSPATVFYLSHFLVSLYTRPVAVLIDRAHSPVLIVPSMEKAIAERLHWEGQITTYVGGERESVPAIVDGLRRGRVGRVGVEPGALPLILADGLRQALPGLDLVDASSSLEPLWWVKEEAEINKIRQAASLCVVGCTEAEREAESGKAELAVKARGDQAIFESAIRRFPDCRIQLFSNVIYGLRTVAGGGHDLPTGRTPRQGELVFLVWAVNCDGYWALMSRTTQVGGIHSNIQELIGAVHEAKLAALDRIRPGAVAAEVHDAAVKRLGASLNRSEFFVSVGRGIGAGIGEGPSLDAGSPHRIQQGMLLRLGPEIFGSFGAVGLIDTVLVTQDGVEIFTQSS